MTRYAFVTSPERHRMLAMRAAGLSNSEIRTATGRSLATIARHIGPRPRTTPHPLDRMQRRAVRLEHLYAACNRALAEVRA